MPEIYGVGDQIIVAYGVETTAGTPLHTDPSLYSLWIYAEPGTTQHDFDPNRVAADVTLGTPYVTRNLIDKKGKGTITVVTKVYPTSGTAFETACGLSGSGQVAPQSLSIAVSLGGKTVIYPGARCTECKFETSADKDLIATRKFEFTGRPVVGAPIAAPTVTIEQPYTFVDITSITLLSGASTNDVEQADITVQTPHAAGYGNHGVPLPNILVLDRIDVMLTIRLFFTDTNIAEYNAFIASGGTGGALTIVFTKGGNTCTFAIPSFKYTKGPISNPKGGLNYVELTGLAYTQDASPFITLVRT